MHCVPAQPSHHQPVVAIKAQCLSTRLTSSRMLFTQLRKLAHCHITQQPAMRPARHKQPCCWWAAASAAHATAVQTTQQHPLQPALAAHDRLHKPRRARQTCCKPFLHTTRTKRKPTNTQQLCNPCCIAGCNEVHSLTRTA